MSSIIIYPLSLFILAGSAIHQADGESQEKRIQAAFTIIVPDTTKTITVARKDSISLKDNSVKNTYYTNMNRLEWISLLGSASRLMAEVFFKDTIRVGLSRHSNETYTFLVKVPLEYLRINIKNYEGEELLVYDIIPWQNFTVQSADCTTISANELLTVTDYAVVFCEKKAMEKSDALNGLIEKIQERMGILLDVDANQSSREQEVDLPPNIQIISDTYYPHYADIHVALPGSHLPAPQEWIDCCQGKMIRLFLIPDIGNVQERWIKAGDLPPDTYYTSVEDELLRLYGEAMEKAIISPRERNEIYNETRLEMRKLFSAANSYVNFLYDTYEERLKRWLLIEDEILKTIHTDEIFGNYQPKLTPDEVLDYMPSLGEDMLNIPESKLENYSALVNLLSIYQENARSNPGVWEDGNMILGAKPREYRPSKDELLSAETGDRLSEIYSNHSKEEIVHYLKENGLRQNDIHYTRFTFIHMDVMGSGRFFYVENSEDVKLSLE